MAASTRRQPRASKWAISLFAFEPPVPTTEITWVALPTEGANQGAPTAPPFGAVAMGTTAAHTAAHTRPSSRRTLLSSAPHDGQVKSRFCVDRVTARPRRSSRRLSPLVHRYVRRHWAQAPWV